MTRRLPESAADDVSLVYFARAVDGLPRAEVLAAARSIRAKLAVYGIEMVDPVAMWMLSTADAPPVDDPVRLVESDLAILRRCDGVLMDMSIPDRNYIGCVCELTYAHLWRIPSVVWVADTGLERRPWLRYHATVVVRTREEALSAIVGLLAGCPSTGHSKLDDQQNDGNHESEAHLSGVEDVAGDQDGTANEE